VAPEPERGIIDSYIVARVAQQIAAQTKGEAAIVRDLSFKAENELIARLKRYGWILGLAGFLLALIGFGSIQQAKTTIVAEARTRVEPVVIDVEKRAHEAGTELAHVEKKLPEITRSMNTTVQIADEQRQRVEGQNAEISRKLADFENTSRRFDQVRAELDSEMNQFQKQIDSFKNRYSAEIAQLSRAADLASVREAYPNLGVKPFVIIAGHRVDKSQKKPGEKWVLVTLGWDAQQVSKSAGEDTDNLVSDLHSAGYVTFVGSMDFGGRLGGGLMRADSGPAKQSAVVYFHPEFKRSAEQLIPIAGRYAELLNSSPVLANTPESTNFDAPRLETVIQESGLDAQIYIGAFKR
jgi:hypothetical protein